MIDKVIMVPTERVPHAWPEALKYIRPAFERLSHRKDEAMLYSDIVGERKRLWVVAEGDKVRGFGVTHVYDDELRRVMAIEYAGGKDVAGQYSIVVEKLEEYAKDMGCQTVEIYGRRGWERALKNDGYAEKAIVLEKDI